MSIHCSRVILFGKNITALKHGYQSCFQFSLEEEIPGEWAVLNAGDFEIAFHKIGAAYHSNDSKPFRANSNTKLVFDIDENDLYAFHENLLKHGMLLKGIKHFGGFIVCDGEDMEGNVFQLRQREPGQKI